MLRKMTVAVVLASLASAALAERIGFVSDTHLGWKNTAGRLEQCYRLFKAQKVDRIVNLGDICEYHNPDWYRQYVEIREKVYPDGVPPEIYVFATHDRMKVKIPKSDRENALAFEMMKPILKVTHDRYDRFESEGFTFLVYPQAKDYKRMEREIAAECAAHPGRPLFVLDHVPPANTVEGSANGGDHMTRSIFDRHPEVIALSGHVHGSQVHEGKIWQGNFTAIGSGTIKHQACPGEGGSFHVMVLDLSKEKAVFRRYDIASGEELHPERPWTLTFPFDPKTAPYRPDVRRAAVPPPAFAAGAELTAKPAGDPLREIEVSFPAAVTPDVSHYEIALEARSGNGWKVRSQAKETSDYVMPTSRRKKAFVRRFSSGYFEEGETVRFAVVPVDFYGNRGEPLRCERTVGKTEKWRTLYEGVPSPAKPGEFTSFRGDSWFEVPPSALDVPAGTPCRIVLDVALDLEEDVGASFNLRTDKSSVYAFGYIYAPLGKSELRHVREFARPKEQGENFNLYLQRAAQGKVRFDRLRIECRTSARQ